MNRFGFSLRHVLWFLPLLFALAWLENQWPVLAFWCFVLLTLTLGFAHGAMDIWLLMGSSRGEMLRRSMIYGASAVAIAVVLLPFPAMALIALLLLSVWHFGEQAVTLEMDAKTKALLRIVQGGASVMLPVLISGQEMKAITAAISQASFSWVWPLWVFLAALWLALLVAAVGVLEPWRKHSHDVMQHRAMKTLAWEIAALILLNLLLSPLLAFTLFFGVYHSGMHVRRTLALRLHQGQAMAGWLLAATLCVTWLGLAWLAWYMPTLAQSGGWQGESLRWIVVALAAVTLPHMLLVSRWRERLFATG